MDILKSTPVGGKSNLSQAALNYVARTRKSVVVHNAQIPHEILPMLHSEAYIRKAGVKSLLCMPILVSAADTPELIGVLYFENNLTSHAFTQERIETLEIISLSAAGRLELSRKAVTDGLTGLYNHDYFHNTLQQELLLAKRKGRELSLMMIDIDHFKQFNDKWGHQAGDLVLRGGVGRDSRRLSRFGCGGEVRRGRDRPAASQRIRPPPWFWRNISARRSMP